MDETALQADSSPSDLKHKLNELDTTLQQLQRVRQRLEDTEQRFSRITTQCGGLLDALVRLDQQHAASVAAVNTRLTGLVDESARRIESFERGVSHEWTVLRQLYEAPLEDLRRQASELRAACLEVARALGPAPSPEAAYEALAANTASAAAAPPPSDAAGAWSLEEVARLHQRVRESGNGASERSHERDSAPAALNLSRGAEHAAERSLFRSAPLALPESSADDSSERHVAGDRRKGFGSRSPRLLWAFIVLLLIVAAGLTAYTFQLWDRIGQLDVRASKADQRLSMAEQQVEAVQKSAERRVGDLQEASARAARVADVLAAPDLQRLDLMGLARSGGAYAQVLWSRSRGLVASASRLPPPGEGRAYQLWVLTNEKPVSAGLIQPDQSGRGSLLIGGPLTFPRRMGLVVTLEPAAGSTGPIGPVYLRGRQ
jgi:hypothetical protein